MLFLTQNLLQIYVYDFSQLICYMFIIIIYIIIFNFFNLLYYNAFYVK